MSGLCLEYGVTREQARTEASGQAVETVKVEWEE